MRVFHNNVFLPESQVVKGDNKTTNPPINSDVSFENILSNKITDRQSLHFSKHANMRLSSREITLSSEQIKRVEGGVSKAAAKGINDSLVMVDNIALVVNVRNKIVITAMNQDNENVFTNIDGAVIV